MSELIIKKLDETYLQIQCDSDVALEIYDRFSFEVPGAKWNPKVRAGIWDGYIRLFQTYNYSLYIGLLGKLEALAVEKGWTVSYADYEFEHLIKLTNKQVDDYITSLKIHADGNPITAHPHQKAALYRCLIDAPRQTILSPTASGKSFSLYVLARYYTSIGKKVLLVVPNVSLVNQMFSDFGDYSSEVEWDVHDECHLIMGGKEKSSPAPIFISTWQSIYKQKKQYFSQFDCVLVDEVHQAQANSIKGIMEKATNAKYKYGFTGTLSEAKTHELIIEGLFGPIYKVVKTSELMEQGLIANIDIKVCFLEYCKKSRDIARKMSYQEEVEFTVTNPNKLAFTCALANKIQGNTLILVNWVEKHAEPLYKKLLQNSEKVVYYIHGGTKADQREEIRKLLETEDNAILVATYGTLAVGVNIKNLHNIIFASTFKSKIRVLQSIGRGLRITHGKASMTLYDLVDDLTYHGPRGAKVPNYLMNHFFKRLQFYKEEGFKFSVHQKKIEKEE